MASVIRFHFWPPLSSTPDEHLKEKVIALAGELFSKKVVKEKLEKAKEYAEGTDRSVGWKRWMWLINTHRTARRQASLLNKCTSRIAQSRLINMRRRDVKCVLKCFKDPIGKVGSRKELKEKLASTRKDWLRIQKKVEEVRLPISFTNVLLLLRTRSGIETTSLLIGGLIAVGAVYMSYFVETAVGISAYTYWTVEDLVVQGILMAPYIVGGLLAFEVLFFALRLSFTRRWRYVVYGWISKFHLSSVSLFLVFMMIVVSLLGLSRGNGAFQKFARMSTKSAQMATAIGGKRLNNVYLVSTSDRTAIFLRAKFPTTEINSESNNSRVDSSSASSESKDLDKPYNAWRDQMKLKPRRKAGYWKTTSHVLFPFSDKKPSTAPSSSKTGPKLYGMVVMDRALILCHAQQGECP